MSIDNAQDVKLNIKPLTIGLVHEYVFEGPCRFGRGEELTAEFDEARTAQIAGDWNEQLVNNLGKFGFVNVMDPYVSKRDETFPLTDEILDEACADAEEVDLYAVTYYPFGIDLALQVAKRTKKPIACLLTGSATGTATIATLSAHGCECYGWTNWQEAETDVRALLARKVMGSLRVLALVRNNSTTSISAPDSFIDHGVVADKMGIRFTYMNLHEFVDQTHECDPSKNPSLPGRVENNITAEEAAEIERMTDELVACACEVDMPKENVAKSMKAHVLTKKLLAKTGCNGFTAPCPDMCATRRLNEEQFTMCLNHSLNNEEGICSACEYDVTALVSMQLLSAISRTAPYMGNTMIVKYDVDSTVSAPKSLSKHEEAFAAFKESIEGRSGIVCTYHSTPNRKLRGFDADASDYAIRPFAMDGRWGATIRYDFAKDAGQVVTVARFDPTCSKLFVARGSIVSGAGYYDENCSEGVYYAVNDIDAFNEGSKATGNHMALVYGDVFDATVRYGQIAGFDVIACA